MAAKVLAVLTLWPALAGAQTPALDAALRFGTIATLSPLCGLRDAAWATDLQRAQLRAMGARPDEADPALRPLADRAIVALSYAEDEALEQFANAAPEATCLPLAHSADLAQADRMVAAQRAGLDPPVW